MKLDSFNKSINDTEKSMGFVSLSKDDIKMFPSVKTKIIIRSSVFPKDNIVCTFDPKYKRIYGSRKILQECNNNLLFIKKISNKNYFMSFK